MKDTICFLHRAGAHDDKELKRIIGKFGASGYGAYWYLREHMRSQKDLSLCLQDVELYAPGIGLSGEELRKIVEYGISCGAFVELEGGRFTVEELVADIKNFEEKRIARQEAVRERVTRYRQKGNALRSQSVTVTLDTDTDTAQDTDTETDTDKEGGLGGAVAAKPKPPPPRVTLAPKLSMTEPERDSLLEEFGTESVTYHAKTCSDYLLQSGKVKKNCAAFMRTWIRKDLAEMRGYYSKSAVQARAGPGAQVGFWDSIKKNGELENEQNRNGRIPSRNGGAVSEQANGFPAGNASGPLAKALQVGTSPRIPRGSG